MMSASPMIEPTVIRGFREAYGSWKMICISFRRPRSDRLSRVVTFLPWNQASPDVGSMRRRIVRPVVDLPQRDFARDEPAPDGEVLLEVLDAQKRLGHG